MKAPIHYEQLATKNPDVLFLSSVDGFAQAKTLYVHKRGARIENLIADRNDVRGIQVPQPAMSSSFQEICAIILAAFSPTSIRPDLYRPCSRELCVHYAPTFDFGVNQQ